MKDYGFHVLMKKNSSSTLQPEGIVNALLKPRKRKIYRCKICSNQITTSNEKIQKNGSHHHYFKNPSGVSFKIGLFNETRSVITTGEPSLEATWFPPYKWRIVICHKCKKHLGWEYIQENRDNFFGLILDHLYSSDQ